MNCQGVQNSFLKGVRDGLPIGLGYISVSFTFGMMAVSAGLPLWGAALISMTNLTSAGQFAGLELIVAGASLVEMALTQLVINLRYALMSLSVSQKLAPSVTMAGRLMVSFGVTDEIFAVAAGQQEELGRNYLLGLILLPFFGWSGGTLLGAAASSFLPDSFMSALGIAIYGMFLAIIIPPARKLRPVLKVILLSVALSCLFRWVPVLNQLSSGFVIIICAVAASAFGAYFFPVAPAKREEG